MSLMRVRLEVACIGEFPNGSSRHGYEFVAPLTDDGHIDEAAWPNLKDRCIVLRFWGDAPVEYGRLRHAVGGWRFAYDPAETSNGQPGFKLDRIVSGGYITIRDHDGVQRPFRITEVTPASRAAAA